MLEFAFENAVAKSCVVGQLSAEFSQIVHVVCVRGELIGVGV